MGALVYAKYPSEDHRSTVVRKSQVIAHSVKDPADFKRSIRLVSVSCDSIVRRKRQSCEMVRNKYRSGGAEACRQSPSEKRGAGEIPLLEFCYRGCAD